MATIYLLRTPGQAGFGELSTLHEGRVYDNVDKNDAEKLVEAGLAEEYDEDNELHAKSVEEYKKMDGKRKTPVKAEDKAEGGVVTNRPSNEPIVHGPSGPVPTKPVMAGPAAAKSGTATDYADWTNEELHAEASKRNLPGRSGLDKASITKLLEADDKAAAKGKK